MTLASRGRAVTALALLLLVGVYVRALVYTPIERFQGPAQKIFYLHVPAAWSAMLAMGLVGLASVLYLLLKDPRYDRFAAASAEVGTVFCVVMLTTGPLWARPVWGTWWAWDARLTLTLFLFFLYIGYLLLRQAVPDPGMRGRYSAVLGICGTVLLPFIHLSVYLFRTLHPMPIVLKPERPSLPSEMLTSFVFSTLAFLFFCAMLIRARYRLAVARAIAADAS
jgi:heme exporter protein C